MTIADPAASAVTSSHPYGTAAGTARCGRRQGAAGRLALLLRALSLPSGCGPVQQMYDDWLEPPAGHEEKRSGLKQELEERRISGSREARKKEWDAYHECLNRKAYGDPLVIFRECRQPSENL